MSPTMQLSKLAVITVIFGCAPLICSDVEALEELVRLHDTVRRHLPGCSDWCRCCYQKLSMI